MCKNMYIYIYIHMLYMRIDYGGAILLGEVIIRLEDDTLCFF